MENSCEHNFAHLGSSKKCDSGGGYNLNYKRVDYFYCTKCLQYKEISQDKWSRETPDFYLMETKHV